MVNYKDRTCAVIDNGLFTEVAVTLAKSFKKTYYFTPWESSFPKSNSFLVGKGLPNVERIDSFWKLLPEIDLFVFPDCYHGPLQVQLELMGKRVWGSRLGENLELDRVPFKKHAKKIGLDIGEYTTVTGLDNLREHLKKNKDKFVKVSRTRGDFESFKAENYRLVEPRLDDIEWNLGPKKHIMDFIIEDPIDAVAEVGYDGYTVNGNFPKTGTWGIEVKSKSFLMKVDKQDKMPVAVKSVNDKLHDTLKSYRYRGFFSTEVRATKDGKAYVLDPCARLASPPGELMLAMFENIAEVIWEGAGGTLVEPKTKAKWGAQCTLFCQFAEKNWASVDFPASMREVIKLRNTYVNKEGRYYVVPHTYGMPDIGSVIGFGDTADEAIVACRKNAEKVKGYGIEVSDELDKAKEEMDKAATLKV